MRHSFVLSLCILVAGIISCFGGPYDKPSMKIKGHFDAYIHCKDLSSPDGLAIHPTSGELYVSEETKGRISVIRDHQRITVVQSEFEVIGDIPAWALTRERPESVMREAKIHSPEGIAFTKEGHLLVTEDVPNGRLLEFIPDEQGRYLKARVIPIPWLANGYAWEGITVADDGRIFIAGSTENSGPGIAFGTVLMREAKGDWWVVDYGPFNSFSSVALSKDQDILVVGDSLTGAVNWWDAVRHHDIGVSTGMVAQIEGLCVLPDGAILAAQESSGAMEMNAFHKTSKVVNEGGKLVYINPETHETFVVAHGFGEIESVLLDEASGYVYVTEDNSGKIYQLRPHKDWDRSHYALQRTIRTYERSEGMAPKTWPPFLKQFFGRMGVGTRNELASSPSDKKKSFTLKEFAERVPLVAGRFQTNSKGSTLDPDPIVEVDFVSFFPGNMVQSPSFATPSLSLFSARRASGKQEKSQLIGDMSMYTLKNGAKDWDAGGQTAYMLLPMVSCAAVKRGPGIDINMAFLGMGASPDYFLQIPGGQEKNGLFYSDEDGLGKAQYDASFVEESQDGGEVHNLVVAGFEAHRTERVSWYHLGHTPVATRMSLGTEAKWMPRSLRMQGGKLLAMLEQREESQLLAEDRPASEVEHLRADRLEEGYTPTVSIEHIKGSMEVDASEDSSTEEHAAKQKAEDVESAQLQDKDSGETALLSAETPYWELAFHQRAIKAWGASAP